MSELTNILGRILSTPQVGVAATPLALRISASKPDTKTTAQAAAKALSDFGGEGWVRCARRSEVIRIPASEEHRQHLDSADCFPVAAELCRPIGTDPAGESLHLRLDDTGSWELTTLTDVEDSGCCAFDVELLGKDGRPLRYRVCHTPQHVGGHEELQRVGGHSVGGHEELRPTACRFRGFKNP